MSAPTEPIFVDLSESEATEIESLCMKCRQNVSLNKLKVATFFIYIDVC